MRRGTYSIVARDPASGDFGVAVQSHWFGVGSVVSWARPGAGAVATQSVAEIAFGPRGLELLASGATAAEAVERLVAGDEFASARQLAIVDARGRVATHTGDGCIAHASHATGDGFSCQANIMATDTVPAAMATAYEGADGDLAQRMLAALRAAQREGGDLRGQQSAALLVAPAEGEVWEHLHDVRVDDHADPLGELERLLVLSRAYAIAEKADGLLAAGEHERAAKLYRRSAQLAPGADELRFWAGLGIAGSDLDAGVEEVRAAAAAKPAWLDLLDRLPAQLAPTAAAVRRALGRG